MSIEVWAEQRHETLQLMAEHHHCWNDQYYGRLAFKTKAKFGSCMWCIM